MNKIIKIALLSLLISGCASAPKPAVETEKKALNTDTLFKADTAYRQGRLVDAETLYLKIADSNPTLYEVWFRLGNIYVRTGQLEAAVRAFEKCVKLTPEKSKGWNNLALTRVRQAISTLEEGANMANSSDPDYQQMLRLLGQLHSQ